MFKTNLQKNKMIVLYSFYKMTQKISASTRMRDNSISSQFDPSDNITVPWLATMRKAAEPK